MKKQIFELSKIGKEALKELTDHYKPTNPVESYYLQLLALSVEMAHFADAEMREKGTVQEFKTGARQVSPEFQVLQASIANVRGIAKEIDSLYEGSRAKETEAVKSIMHLNKKIG